MQQYEEYGVVLIKSKSPTLAEIPDAGVAELYRRYSQETACAGWLTLFEKDVPFFLEWVFTSPLDAYRKGLQNE